MKSHEGLISLGTEEKSSPYNETVCLSTGCLGRQGVAGAFIAGISFIVYQMLIAWLVTGFFFSPLRMIAAMLLGPDALATWYSLFAVALVGIGIHFIFSIIFGLIFGRIIARRQDMASTRRGLVFMASTYGFLLWLINFYVIAPIFGWMWFPALTDPFLQGFIGHTFFFGTVLGYYFARRLHAGKV